MRNKILIFIDVVAPKNILQIEAMMKYGYKPHFFVTHKNAISGTSLNVDQTILQTNFLKRLSQLRNFLSRHSKSVHHLEVYPGGRFSFLYVVFAKAYRLKCICVERGDLLYFHKNGYSRFVRFSMWFCYKFSDLVWYREPYMKPLLEKLNKNLFFLHNAVRSDDAHKYKGPTAKDITFLWMNRVIPERRHDWFIEVLAHPELKYTKNYLVGITANSFYKKDQQYILGKTPDNLVIADYCTTPQDFFKRAKFFVLPADVVFANHALLEAMSYGVVPLVSDQDGSSLIIEDGKSGFIFNHTKEDFEAAILKAYQLKDEDYSQLSFAATRKIKDEFSEEKYNRAIKKLYDRF